jgi:hypothetical protein
MGCKISYSHETGRPGPLSNGRFVACLRITRDNTTTLSNEEEGGGHGVRWSLERAGGRVLMSLDQTNGFGVWSGPGGGSERCVVTCVTVGSPLLNSPTVFLLRMSRFSVSLGW